VKTEGELDDRIEAGKRSVPRPHFLYHDTTVPRPKDVHHPARQNGGRKPVCRLLDARPLGFDAFDQCATVFQILTSR
jgi:hypothetical protein